MKGGEIVLVIILSSDDPGEVISPEVIGPFENYQQASDFLKKNGYEDKGHRWAIYTTITRHFARIVKVVKAHN